MNRNRLIEEKLKKNKQNKIQIGKPTNYRTINFSLKFPNHKTSREKSTRYYKFNLKKKKLSRRRKKGQKTSKPKKKQLNLNFFHEFHFRRKHRKRTTTD